MPDSLPEPEGRGDGLDTGDAPLNPAGGLPKFTLKGRPNWVPGHSLLGGGFYESRIDVQFTPAAGLRPA